MDRPRVVALLGALAQHGVRYKVVGGVALNFVGLARATEDLDIFVAVDDENVARLRDALRALYGDPQIDEITAGDLAGEYPAVQYVPPDGAFHVDILARLGEGFAFDDIESSPRDVDGIVVQVATPRMLYRMKKDTVRPRDKADAAWLRQHFDVED